MAPAQHLLGMDTCGPSGSVALVRCDAGRLELLDQVELPGRTYSATLVGAVREMLARRSLRLGDLAALVVVSGPGSFTGVRVGLSAAKGFAEPSGLPIVAVSRLAVLAQKAGTDAAALDAQRGEVFLRLPGPAEPQGRELLAAAEELAREPMPRQIAICDAAAEQLRSVWPAVQQVVVTPPLAADALQYALPRVAGRDFDDPATLDGHYLRRSDAEIFGSGMVPEPSAKSEQR
jgi:tRNA threonylcarbamoyladenosine biosynthesis protein TsaB